jgi:outer membrane immunogenic protein
MIAATAVFVGGTGFASAADLSYKDPPYYSAAPLAPVWAGMYIGGHLGGLSSSNGDVEAWINQCNKGWKKTDKIEFDEDDDDTTFIGGVHVGYNWQRNATVIGIEADVSFADEIDYLASLRGRLGFARGNLLIYATAGVALASFDESLGFSAGGKSFSFDSDDDAEVGFVVGGGVEYKLRPNWSVGLEGLYYAFEDDDSEQIVGDRKKKFKVTREDDNDFWVVRARLSYHLQSEEAIEPLK